MQIKLVLIFLVLNCIFGRRYHSKKGKHSLRLSKRGKYDGLSYKAALFYQKMVKDFKFDAKLEEILKHLPKVNFLN